jgi:hypothetical protein
MAGVPMMARIFGRRGASGQAIILIAAAMPVFLAMGGFVIEGGHMFVAKRHLQNVADAAALAAARDLPGNGAACDAGCVARVTLDVTNYAHYNNFDLSPPKHFHPCDPADPTDSNCFETPHGSNDLIQVRVKETLAPIFANALGMGPFTISAKATASADQQVTTTTTPDLIVPPGTTTYTIPGSTTVETTPDGVTTITTPGTTVTTTNPDVTTTSVVTQTTLNPGSGTGGVAFAMSSQCEGTDALGNAVPAAISYTGAGGKGSPFTVGSLLTNGGINVSGNLKTVSWLAWGKRGTSGCDQITGQGQVNTKIGPFSHVDWPVPPPANPAPDCVHVASVSAALAMSPGKYCITGSISFTGVNAIGYTWFATGSITVASTNQTFSSFGSNPNNPVFVAGGNISISGNGNSITGSMFAPNGSFSISGAAATGGSGFIEAQTVALSGNLSNYTGTGGFGGGGVTTTTVTTTTIIPGSTTVSTTPGSTSTVTTPGGTTTITVPDSLSTTTYPGVIQPGSTNTITTGTTIGMNE